MRRIIYLSLAVLTAALLPFGLNNTRCEGIFGSQSQRHLYLAGVQVSHNH